MFRGKLVELRAPVAQDQEVQYQWKNDYDTAKWYFVSNAIYPPSREGQPVDPNTSDHKRFSIYTLQNPACVGTIYLFDIDWRNRNAWSAFVVLPPHRGLGYCTEANFLLLDYAFNELNLERVNARVIDGNAASCRLMTKCGYTLEGRLRQAVYRGGEYHDLLMWGILRSDLSRCPLVSTHAEG